MSPTTVLLDLDLELPAHGRGDDTHDDLIEGED